MLMSDFLKMGDNGIFDVQESNNESIKLAGMDFNKEEIKTMLCRQGILVAADIVKALEAIQPVYKALSSVWKKDDSSCDTNEIRLSVKRSEEYGKVIMRAEIVNKISGSKHTIISGAKGVSGKYNVYTNGVTSSSEKFTSAAKAVQYIYA